MAEVLKTIKADGTGDYSTISAWESLLDDSGIYNAGDDAVGEIYSGTYNEQATVNGGGTIGLTSVTLRAHSSARHTGRSGTGVRVVCQGANPFWGDTSGPTYNFEWFEYDGNGMDDSEIIALQSGATTRCRNLIVHNAVHTSTTFACYGMRARGTSDNHEIDNCLVYNIEQTGGQRLSGILLTDSTTGKVRNCTVTDIRNTNVTSGDSQGINFLDTASQTIQNNLVTNIQSTAGTAECYDNATVTSAVTAGNVSDDATSPQTHLRNAVIAFEDAANDIYWPGAGDTLGWGKGTDLGSGQIALDLLGRDRDTAGDSWDAGAFQHALQTPYFVGGASGTVLSGTSVTVTVSGIDIQEGDVIVAVMHSNEVTGALSGDATYTFTKDFEETNPSIDTGLYGVFSRVATASEPTSYQFNHSGLADRNEVQLSVFRNVDTSNIWEVAPSASTRASGDSGTTATSPTLTTSNDGALGIVFALRDSGATTGFTAINEGYTNEVSLGTGGDQCTFMWSRMFLVAGSQPAVDATLSADDAWVIHQFALKPAVLHAIQEVGYASDGVLQTTETSGSVTHNIDIQDGDLVVALIHVNTASNTINDNNGANSFTTRVDNRNHSGASSTYEIADRVAGASEPSSYGWNGWSTPGEWSIIISVFRNANGWNVAPNTANEAIQSSGTSLAIGSITPTVTDTLTLGFHGSDSDPFTFGTVDNGFVYKHKEETGRPAALVAKYTEPASAVGTTTVSWTGTNDMFGMLAAIAPGGTGPVITDVANSGETPGAGSETWNDGSTGNVISGTGFTL